jgi:hypothetical protein
MTFNEEIKINVGQKGLEGVYSDLDDLRKLIERISKTPLVVKVKFPGISAAVKNIDRLEKKLDAMSKKSYKIPVAQVNQMSQTGQPRVSGATRGRSHSLGGLFAHAIPINFYNAINALRLGAAVGAATTAGGMVGGPGGMAIGAGIAATVMMAVAAIHAHSVAINMATSIIRSSFNLAAQSVVSFSSHMFDTIEETRRAQVSFAALASMHTGKSLGQLRSDDPQTFNAAMRVSKIISDRMRTISSETGQEFSRVAGAAKSLMADVLDKMNKTGGGNALLQKPDEVIKVTEGLIRLGAVMRMSDPMGRNLSQQIFPLQEILSGTSGKGAAELFTSLRKRTGIKISGQDANQIAAAVNAGNLSKMMELLSNRMARAGVAVTMIADLFKNTLSPNIDSIRAQFSSLFMSMFGEFYDSVLGGAKFLRTMLTKMSFGQSLPNSIQTQMKAFGTTFIKTMVESFLGTTPTKIGKADLFLKGFFDQSVLTNPMSAQNTIFSSIKNTILSMIPATKAFVNVLFQFFTGLLGLDSKAGRADMFKTIERSLNMIAPMAKEFGSSLAEVSKNIVKAAPAMMYFALGIQQFTESVSSFLSPIMQNVPTGGSLAANVIDSTPLGWNPMFMLIRKFLPSVGQSFNPQNNPASLSSPFGFGRSPLAPEHIAKLMGIPAQSMPTDPRILAQRFPPTPTRIVGPVRPTWLAPSLNRQPIFERHPNFPRNASPPQLKVDVKSAPNIKNEFRVNVQPQIENMAAKIYEASYQGSKKGTEEANSQNKASLNFAFSNAMSELSRSLNSQARDAAPNGK